jgi:3-hydroxyisobutyrate dehydrogenase-like beta-hydroxyacid dehydrogenase
MKNEVSVIGLGVMGSALARTLLRHGYRVTVWNRTSAKAKPLISDGALLADDAAAAVSATPIVLVALRIRKSSTLLRSPFANPRADKA